MKVCSTLKFGLIVLLFASVAQAQSIDISKFYYRDYLDFGQGYGAFNGENSGKANTSNGTTLTGKDGTQVSVPNVPNFSASSNYGSLTSVGRGFAVTANHVTSPESIENLRKFGLTTYTIAKEKLVYENGVSVEINSISNPYGWDSKFLRFNKYIVEGQVDLLDIDNTTSQSDKGSNKETTNLNNFKAKLNELKDKDGNVYLYQAGSGDLILFGTSQSQGKIYLNSNGEMRGGGFGTLQNGSINYGDEVNCERDDKSECVRGISFNYKPNLDFRNIITEGDSGSGIYAYDSKNQKWILLGVTSKTFIQVGGDEGKVSFASNKDLQNYQNKFEQNINLKIQDPADANTWTLNGNNLKFEPRGDTPNESHILETNKDIIFRGGGTIKVQSDIDRMQNGYAGGFVFEKANTLTTYKFTNANGGNYYFKGSGLDIGENVKVEWALRNDKNDALHKIGKGELIVKTNYTPTSTSENLGTLKIGEGKVTLNTDKKAFDNIYITSGRGELALVSGKAQALGASPTTTNGVNSANSATSANSYTLSQDKNSEMGFYFGKGGGKFDLAGNSLVLNTIAANDSKAIITNSNASTQSTLEIQGYGYTDNKKTNTKADTIIHASIGDNTSTNGTNLNLIYKGDKTPTNSHSERSEESTNTNSVDSSLSAKAQNDSTASLIFDGHINIKGELKATNANIVLQGHPTTHATISDSSIRDKIQSAESGTSQKMPDYMDLSKPSNLQQPDWDSRNFTIGGGINLTNTTLTVGKAANLTADITADKDSQINFGGRHFIDSKDGKNVIGSGFSYQQVVTSDILQDESYKDSSYSGIITASGTNITSKFMNFAPNLTLTNGANLSATNLTLNTNSNLNLSGKSTAQIDNLIIKELSNLDGKITLDSTSKFAVKEGFIFDKSTFNLNSLNQAGADFEMPTEYNLAAFNGSQITASDFKNSRQNAEFTLDKSTFTATSASFQSTNLNLNLSNSSTMNLTSLNSTGETSLIIKQGSTLKTTGDIDLKKATIQLTSENSSLNAKNLTLNEKSSIILDDKAELTLTEILTSKDLTLTLENESKFTAKTLTASGVVNLKGDKNATLTLDTLNLNNGNATLNANGSITNLNLNNVKETAIGENVSITTLKLTDSTANLELLNGQIPKTIDLKTNSTLRLNELNLNEFNTKGLTLTSDTTSQAHIKRLVYDTTKAQTNGANKIPQSNLSVSELFKLDNVGKNLGQNTQGTEQEKLNKDLLTLEFGKTLTLQSSATLQVNFAELIKENNNKLKFGDYYTIFSAKTLACNGNISLNFAQGTNLFAEGFCDSGKKSFLVKFRRDDPRNFGNLNPHIKNPTHSPLLEILLQHNKNDESIDKAINMRDYSTLNQRLAQIDTSLKTIANADSAALKTLPLLQKQEINARIQQNRFTTAKFALAKITNPAQKSDIVPTLLYLDENERQNRVWSGASASFFGNGSDKFSLQSVSIGYDRKLFGDEFLLGILASLTNTQLSSDETSLNPKIYTLALYSDALFRHGELQNELSFSLLNGDKGFESESGSYKSFYGFFESVYKVQTAFLPQSIKPIVLGRVNLRHFDEFSTATYKQKADDDISVDLGVGVEWLWQKESGFYSASFVAERDIYHSQKERLMSLTGAQKFVAYETNEPSFAYQLYLAGLENFKNGIYLRYGLSGFVDSKAYKGFKADVQVGYRF